MSQLPECSRSITRKARKSHKCNGCYAEIKSGDSYQYTSGIWDEPESHKHCLNCAYVIDNFRLMDEGLSIYDGPCLDLGGVKEWFHGFVCSGWYGVEAAEETAKLFGLPLEYTKSIFGDEK